jgi:copper chaperone NosL
VIRVACAAAILALTGCVSGPPPPATMAQGDTCAYCRMMVAPSELAAELVVPGDDPRFFDDIGCLAAFLKEHEAQPADAVAYVKDHQTRRWIRADAAIYTRVADLDTPMGSRLVAHAGERLRRDDPITARGSVVAAGDVFDARMPQGGKP